MLRAPSLIGPNVGDLVLYTDSNGSTKQYRVASTNGVTIGLNTPDGVMLVDRKKVVTSDQKVLLDTLDEEDWTITSFDSKTRVVCIDIATASGARHIAVTLPALI